MYKWQAVEGDQDMAMGQDWWDCTGPEAAGKSGHQP
jgi:hypothetical protein